MDFSRYSHEIAPSVLVGLKAMMPQGNLNDFVPRWVPTPYNRRLSRAQNSLRDVMHKVIREHEVGGDGTIDLITLLQSAKDEETGRGLTDQELHDEVMTIFMAGHETTGNGMAWTLYAVAEHPEVRERLEAEVDEVLDGRPPTLEDLPNLTYTKMVVEESLRMYPPIWGYTRDPIADDEIDGYRFRPARPSSCRRTSRTATRLSGEPRGVRSGAVRTGTRRRATRRSRTSRSAAAPRKCIGFHLALLQMQLVTAMVSQRFRVETVRGTRWSTGGWSRCARHTASARRSARGRPEWREPPRRGPGRRRSSPPRPCLGSCIRRTARSSRCGDSSGIPSLLLLDARRLDRLVGRRVLVLGGHGPTADSIRHRLREHGAEVVDGHPPTCWRMRRPFR